MSKLLKTKRFSEQLGCELPPPPAGGTSLREGGGSAKSEGVRPSAFIRARKLVPVRHEDKAN